MPAMAIRWTVFLIGLLILVPIAAGDGELIDCAGPFTAGACVVKEFVDKQDLNGPGRHRQLPPQTDFGPLAIRSRLTTQSA